jgi:hypothetical protein
VNETQKIPWKRLSVEAAAIVVSILLAFAIDAWWDERQERQAELDYLIALQRDFSETRESLENQVDRVSSLFSQVDQVLSVIADTESAKLPDSFSSMVGAAYSIPRPVTVTGTYEDMVNSGSLQLIRNEELRLAMAKFMSILEIMNFRSNLNLQTFWSLHAPFVNQYLLFDEFAWHDNAIENAEGEVKYVAGPPIKHSFELDVEAIKTQEFWNLMTGWKVLYGDHLSQSTEAQKLCTDILNMLDDVIESNTR